MAKLHIYKKTGKRWSKVANGDGTIGNLEFFTVTITSGASAISAGHTYDVRQGQSPTGKLCNCTAINDKVATFQVSDTGSAPARRGAVTEQDLEDFYTALDAVSKNVQILIDAEDLETLKANNYSLCFAKKVGSGEDPGSYNVVWQSLTNYLHSTTFSWTPQFALFGSNVFDADVQVTAETNIVVIELGQQSVLDPSGNLDSPSTGGPSTAVTMVDQYGQIHPGLSQISTLNGVSQVTPLYVAQDAIVQGEATLTPIEMVLVWFEQDVETSTMFSAARSLSVEIDLTETNSAVRLYQGEKWVTP
ncbi:hypothetical protein [uncultured Sphingomonas sp.]|uniref:hypothetical protein n=1 Tax=uncultured Sphingomonas sp. TaxID=158754 RepID=UPI001575ACC5